MKITSEQPKGLSALKSRAEDQGKCMIWGMYFATCTHWSKMCCS